MPAPHGPRPLALVTGASRQASIGAAMPHRSDPADADRLSEQIVACGARTVAIEADLNLVETPGRVFDAVESAIGPLTALVLSHGHSVDSGIIDTTIESFDRHFAVNARASWLLVREFGRRFRAARGSGRIVALTSDHVAGNLPYGASKGALDRIVLAAAREFRDLGITANVVNPGPTDTGWMAAEQIAELVRHVPGGRVSRPEDCANLVRFLCSADGGWINGQLLHSNGGLT